jgi:hypothetical protein
MHFDPNHYGPIFRELVDTQRSRALDAGSAVTSMSGKLRGVSIEAAFAHAGVANLDMASCCLAAVWLLYDFLDESHVISQDVHNSSGSFWHGIMHRREGDFSNAKYWFRHVGSHAIYADLAAAARDLAPPAALDAARGMTAQGEWNPHRFVDLCQAAVNRKSGDESYLLSVQQAEWELLFDHCYAAAVGR